MRATPVQGKRPLDLTATEFQLLATLARQPGRVFTRSQLLDSIRGVPAESFDRAIDAHIKNLRRTLEPDPRDPRFILTPCMASDTSLPNDEKNHSAAGDHRGGPKMSRGRQVTKRLIKGREPGRVHFFRGIARSSYSRCCYSAYQGLSQSSGLS